MSRDASQTRTSSRSGFDGTPAGDAEDADGEDDARGRPSSVLWEKRIEQSIFVDISDDDSLHFSDLQDAFTVRLSQGSGAPGSPQFTDVSCETEKGSTEGTESISSECVEHINKPRKTPMVRSAVKAVVEKHEDDAINTSDEEHEELPYDGAHSNDKTGRDIHATYPNGSEIIAMMSVKETSNHKATKDVAPPLAVSHISDFLLRHFSQEELLNSSRMIEAETLPEISLMDSMDETVLSRVVSHAPRINSEEMETIQNKIQEPNSTTTKSHGLLDVTVSEEDTEEAANNCSDTNISNVSNSTNKPENVFIEDTASSRGSDVVSAGEDVYPKQSFSASSLDLSKADAPKVSFSRTRCFSEMKYGQGQVHYPLPDFSKVAPKVKIPKCNGTVKPLSHSQSPALARVQSSPVILGKNTSSATADVISRVLEDSHIVFSDKEEQSGLAHQLQAEYDRLLAKYTDTEILIGQQIHASSEPSVSINWSETTTNNDNISKLTAKTPQAPTAAGSGEEQCCQVQSSLPLQTEPQTLTDGERLTSDLREIISSFVQKVDEFKTCVNTMSMNVQEQQMMLKSMMEAQDQLERNYLTKREEHRALEMQNYMGLARNTGEFDPDREVEGQIFRIGMQLEDIKEQIDRNICHLFNPPSSSPTPSPPPCKDTSLASPHPSLHEESFFCSATMRENMENEEEEDFEVGDEDNRAESSFILQCSTFTTPTPGTSNEEDSLTATGEEDFYEDVLTQGSTPAALKQKPTYDRCEETTGPGEGSFSSVGIHYTGPSAENSPEPTKDKTQRFVRPEIDSGFGSTDISRPTTGLSHTSPNALSSSALSDDVTSVASISGSDSDASYSNERTTISIATRPVQPTVNNMDYEELDKTTSDTRRNYITQNAPLKVNKVEKASMGCAMSIHENMIEGGGHVHLGKNNAVYETPNRDRRSSSHCSCHNSEVILALQYEVSHLKRALEESLSYLPHMSRRADCLTGGSNSERRHRAQTRGSNSRRVKTDTSLQRTEDWISSDMEPSNSKATEGEDSDHTLSFQRAFSPSHEQTHDRLSSLSDRRSCDTRSPSKASVQSTSQFDPSRCHHRASTGLSIHNTRPTYKSATHRQAMGNPGNMFINSKKSASFFTAHSTHKPLLQVNYGSSCSLPAGFKVRDQESEPAVSGRRRSTQSDSALLPSNVFFQRTSPRTPGRRHYKSREESIHKTLDKALQAAFLMKQTTDRMADALSGDLAKAQLQKKLYGIHPLRSRTRNCDLLSTCSSQANRK